MLTTEMVNELEALITEAERQILTFQDVDQVIVVKTTKSNVYSFPNHIKSKGTSDEESFLRMLAEQEDCEIKYVVAMWTDGSIDIPSMNFRKLLLEASPKNAQAVLALQGEEGIVCKSLDMCMP